MGILQSRYCLLIYTNQTLGFPKSQVGEATHNLGEVSVFRFWNSCKLLEHLLRGSFTYSMYFLIVNNNLSLESTHWQPMLVYNTRPSHISGLVIATYMYFEKMLSILKDTNTYFSHYHYTAWLFTPTNLIPIKLQLRALIVTTSNMKVFGSKVGVNVSQRVFLYPYP